MKRFVVILVMSVLFVLSFSAFAEKFVIVTAEWEPYVIVKDKDVTGIQVEVARELCKRNGIEAEIQVFPWKRDLMMMEEGSAAAIFSAKKTPEREQFLYFPAESFDAEKTVIVALKGSGLKITKLDDLKEKTIGVVRGYAYDPEFDNYKDVQKIESAEDSVMIKVLGGKRMDCAIGDEGALKFIARQAGIELETIYTVNEVPNYIALSKKALGEKGQELAEKFAQTLRQLKEEGVIEKIKAKYF